MLKRCWLRSDVVEGACVVMLSCEVATAPEGVIDGGEKMQVAFCGKPVQDMVTDALNPLLGVSEIV